MIPLAWYLAFVCLLAGLAWYPCGCESEWEDCENCFNGEAPSSITVTLSGMANDSCTGCGNYNDAYIVPYHPTLACTWYRLYDPDAYCASSVYLWRVIVTDATHIEVMLQQNELIEDNNYIACRYYWKDTQESFDCTAWDEYEVPYFARIATTMTPGILCDASSSTLTITTGG